MKYFFIPGRNYELSKAELSSVLPLFIDTYNFAFKDTYILVDTKSSIDVMTRVFNRLGGYKSFGMLYEDVDGIINELDGGKKATFGVSIITDVPNKYPKGKIKEILEGIKDILKEKEVSSRYVMPNGLALDSAQVLHNHLIDRGFELVIFDNEGTVSYGKTLGVQDIETFTAIEFDKPYTNKDMGVLPAKLATIMVNLLGIKDGETIWDPFCGSGTVPLVALLNGYNVLGSDIDQEAVDGTNRNIEWLAKRNSLNSVGVNIFHFDVVNQDRKVVSDLRKTTIKGLVCEPYMGPPQFKTLSEVRANKLLAGVEKLYNNLFVLLENIKLTDFKAVIVIPSYKTFNGWLTLSLNSIVSKKWKVDKSIVDKDLHWKRSNSIIKRNIFVLSKKK
jgi:tRNA G10  N-methylase Trm11